MSETLEIEVVDTYRGVPILEIRYTKGTLFTQEAHRAQLRELLAYPAERMAVVLSYNNISSSSQYGPRDQVTTYQEPEFAPLKDRLICSVPYHAVSLTSLISALSVQSLIRSAGHFAPDRESALRAARRAIEQSLEETSSQPESIQSF